MSFISPALRVVDRNRAPRPWRGSANLLRKGYARVYPLRGRRRYMPEAQKNCGYPAEISTLLPKNKILYGLLEIRTSKIDRLKSAKSGPSPWQQVGIDSAI